MREGSPRKTILFQITLPILALLAVEGALRLAGFEYHNIPRYVRFGDDKYRNLGRSEGHYDFIPDKQLFWRLAPSNPRLLTNAHGFRGTEFSDAKPPGVERIIALGCSCTFGIESSFTYTMALQQFLNRNGAGRRYEVINTGVPGYSSFQGVRLLETELERYRPDILLVYFGWNDHWLARFFEDKEQKTPSAAAQFLLDHASRVRLLQALQKLAASLRGAAARSATLMYRVSPSDYRANLERIAGDAGRLGCRVAFITAPAGYDRPTDVPEYLVREGFIQDNETLLRVHAEYNRIVREVARERNIALVDCAATFDANPAKKSLFGEDGIHPNNQGHRLIAQEVFLGFLRQGWIDRGDYRMEDEPGPAGGH
jgi:lysophospholipase L1-like esterase